MKYRKKPIIVEAEQWWPGNEVTNERLGIKECDTNLPLSLRYGLVWDNLHEWEIRVVSGDWIITGVQGEHYPCKPDVFAETYETVEEKP